MNKVTLAILLCPKPFNSINEKEKAFWVSRAEIAIKNLKPKPFWSIRALITRVNSWFQQNFTSQDNNGGSEPYPVVRRKVRLHPLPEGASLPLASFIGAAVGGAIKDCLNKHPIGLSASQRGLLLGSIRKRAVNQIVCQEGEETLRAILLDTENR